MFYKKRIDTLQSSVDALRKEVVELHNLFGGVVNENKKLKIDADGVWKYANSLEQMIVAIKELFKVEFEIIRVPDPLRIALPAPTVEKTICVKRKKTK